MKFKQLKIKNFGSHKNFSLDFSNLGLISITGETGSGKSTILDMIPWILFGETSKDTKVDDVRSWNSEDPTTGELEVEISSSVSIIVTRVRGSVSENDLYYAFKETPEINVRGKSILETQSLLMGQLGFNSELYFTSAYLHQFSKADSFFMSKPSERRELFEKIVDQSMPIRLSQSISMRKKNSNGEITRLQTKLSNIEGKLESHKESLKLTQPLLSEWFLTRDKELSEAYDKFNFFDTNIGSIIKDLEDKKTSLVDNYFAEKESIRLSDEIRNINQKSLPFLLSKILSLKSNICSQCLRPLTDDIHTNDIDVLEAEQRKYQNDLEDLQLQLVKIEDILDDHSQINMKLAAIPTQNPYTSKLEYLNQLINPYLGHVNIITSKIEETEKTQKELTYTLKEMEANYSLLEILYKASFDLRGAILMNAIGDIEKATNKILTDHFDSQILIKLNLESSDKLELEIQNNGNESSFKQLSGGERCMLKLAFNLSIMSLAENKARVKFSTLMLDEPLTGLSDDLKIKAFSLFEKLTDSYDTVVIIEHSEALKSCFNHSIVVTIVGDESQTNIR